MRYSHTPLSLAAALALAISLGACGQQAPSQATSANDTSVSQSASDKAAEVTCTLKIDATEAEAGMLFDGSVTLEAGASVYQALVDTGLPLKVDTSLGSPYVQGIGDVVVAEAAGWVFTVNGELPTVGADQVEIADGDVIAWHYYADAAAAMKN